MRESRRSLTWQHGGWVLTLAFGIALFEILWQVVPILRAHGHRAIGDLVHVESYGFDLSNCLIPCGEIVPAAMPKDGLPVLRQPRVISAAGVDSVDRTWHTRYLVGSDRVIGVVVNGCARAYPLRVLCWHEVANDTLGGWPIAVAYNPLCDSAAGFERATPEDTLDFGVSGLLWNSSQLLYDRLSEPHRESLWSVLQARAVAGPSSGRALIALPLAVVRWDVWRAQHPSTTVLSPDPRYREEYESDPYRPYWASDQLRFPVRPLPADPTTTHLGWKEPVVAVTAEGRTVAYPLHAIAARASARAEAASWTTTQNGVRLRFDYWSEPPTTAVTPLDVSAAPVSVAQAFWFAWYAQHPEGEVLWP